MTKTPNRPPISARIALGAIILVAVIVRVYLMVSTRSTAEDFYITLRYAENLAHGNGLVYNVGERVLGTTTPLYTLFLALCAWLGLDATTFGKLANIAADGLSCWLIWRLARAADRPGAGLIGAALFALSPPNLTWAISGMETSLVTACTLALFVAVAERRLAFAAGTAALLYMLRIDGLLAVAVAFGGLLWSAKRHGDVRGVLKSAALFVALCLPWTLFAWTYYGSPLPTSALAKLTVYAWMSKGTFPNLQPFTNQMLRGMSHLLLALFAAQGLLGSTLSHSRLRPANLWIVAYYASMALSKGFLFGWYYVPPTGVYFLLAGLGIETLIWSVQIVLGRRPPRNHDPANEPKMNAFTDVTFAKVFLAAVILALGLLGLPKVRAQIAADQQAEERLRKPIGIALHATIKPGERLMLEPIGYIGYFSGARILDAVGLVSPEAIPYYRKGAVSPYLDMMRDLKPEWVLLRAGELADMTTANVAAELSSKYRLEKAFSDPTAPPDSTPAFFLLRRTGE